MEAQPAFQRIVRRGEVLDLEIPAQLRRRQAVDPAASSADASSGGTADATTTASPAVTTTTATTEAPAVTTTTTTTTTSASPPAASTTEAPSSTTSQAVSSTTTSEDASSTTTTTTEAASSSTRSSTTTSAAADTTVTSVITPTTVIVVGTSTITSALAPVTSTGTISASPSNAASSASSGSGLSTGAKIGIGVGAGVGGLIALALLSFFCLGFGRKRREKRDAADNILWPATGDSAALYPEPVHNTGRAGFGVGDDGDEPYGGVDGGNTMGEVAAGAGVAGVLGRYGSQSTASHQPTLPAVPPSIYTTDHNAQYGNNYYNDSTPEAASAYTGYSSTNGQTPSQHSHAPLMLGPAAVGYVASQDRHSPSPPRTGSASYDGHASYEGAGGSQSGHLPFPGEVVPDVPERMLSPRPMQVGDTFGQGYDETDQGKRWRLSVVNDDPRDRD